MELLKEDGTYTTLLKNRLLAKIKEMKPLPSTNIEFQAGHNYAKEEIFTQIKEQKI